jgi:hypothetical protein
MDKLNNAFKLLEARDLGKVNRPNLMYHDDTLLRKLSAKAMFKVNI